MYISINEWPGFASIGSIQTFLRNLYTIVLVSENEYCSDGCLFINFSSFCRKFRIHYPSWSLGAVVYS